MKKNTEKVVYFVRLRLPSIVAPEDSGIKKAPDLHALLHNVECSATEIVNNSKNFNLETLKKDCTVFIRAATDFLSEPRFVAFSRGVPDLFKGIIIMRIMLRVTNILTLKNNSKNIKEILSLYLFDPTRYEHVNAEQLNVLEKTYNDEYLEKSLELINNWLKGATSLNSFNTKCCLNFLKQYNPSPKLYIILILQMFKIGIWGDDGKIYEQILEDIINTSLDDFIAIFLSDPTINKLYYRTGDSLLLLIINKIQQNKKADVLLEKIQCLDNLSGIVNLYHWFGTINSLSFEPFDAYPLNKLDPNKDYFKVSLMRGLKYDNYITAILQNLTEYRTVTTLLLYESLSRGEKRTAMNILNAFSVFFTHNETTRKELELNSYSSHTSPHLSNNNNYNNDYYFFAARGQHSIDSQTTQVNLNVAFKPEEFYEYIQQKCALNHNNDLYFINSSNDFIDMLFDLKLISNKNDFKNQLESFFPQIRTTHKNLLDDNSDNSNLAKRVKALEEEVEQLKESNKNLLTRFNKLMARLDQANTNSDDLSVRSESQMQLN